MTKTTPKLMMMMALAALFLGFSATAVADSYRAMIDAPVVVGDQLFAGGVVQVSTVGSPNLLAVSIDGQRVALIYRQDFERQADSSRAQIVFQKDERGFYHLASWNRQAAQPTPRPVHIAAVSQGVSTVTGYRPMAVQPGEVIASR